MRVPGFGNTNGIVKLQIKKAPSTSPVRGASLEEQAHFEFFKSCTASKLPGVFGTRFWTSLVFQACTTEPSVLHAVLALSAAHKRKELDGTARDRSLVLPDQQEAFLLRHYCKAIDYLQPQLLPSGGRSVRTALVTCLIFIYLEFLRGNYVSAFTHLHNGLKLVKEIIPEEEWRAEREPPRLRIATKSSTTALETLDGCLIDAFSRLHVQAALAGHYFERLDRFPYRLVDLPTLRFWSPNEARYYLDQIFDGINHLTTYYEESPDPGTWPTGFKQIVQRDHYFMDGALRSWFRTYTATLSRPTNELDPSEDFAYQVLRLYSTTATIMVATCMNLHRQAIFDQHIPGFVSIIVQAVRIAKMADQARIHDRYGFAAEWSNPKRCRAVSDIGWIPPLYYTAIKCRNHRVRTQAVRLLSSRWHNESIWDSKWAASVAQEVIRIEEGDFFAGQCDVFDIEGTPGNRDLHESTPLPEGRRFRTVSVILPEKELGRLQFCGKWWGIDGWRVVRREFDKLKGTWTNVEMTEERESCIDVSVSDCAGR